MKQKLKNKKKNEKNEKNGKKNAKKMQKKFKKMKKNEKKKTSTNKRVKNTNDIAIGYIWVFCLLFCFEFEKSHLKKKYILTTQNRNFLFFVSLKHIKKNNHTHPTITHT